MEHSAAKSSLFVEVDYYLESWNMAVWKQYAVQWFDPNSGFCIILICSQELEFPNMQQVLSVMHAFYAAKVCQIDPSFMADTSMLQVMWRQMHKLQGSRFWPGLVCGVFWPAWRFHTVALVTWPEVKLTSSVEEKICNFYHARCHCLYKTSIGPRIYTEEQRMISSQDVCPICYNVGSDDGCIAVQFPC